MRERNWKRAITIRPKGRWLLCLYCSSKWRTRLPKGRYPRRCPRCEDVVGPCQMVMDVQHG